MSLFLDALYYLGQVWCVIGGWELYKYLNHRRKFPYRWKCPKCNFKVETNVRETYEISKGSHNHSRLEEFKPR